MSWEEKKLRDLCLVITKGTTPSNVGERFTDYGVKYIRSEMITSAKYISGEFLFISHETHEKLKRSQLKAGDILFSMAGVYLGKTALLREEDVPANTNQAVALIRIDKSKYNHQYVYYYLNLPHIVSAVNTIQSQSAQPNINLKQIGNIEIRLPNLLTQRKIADILSAYDDLIENNQKQIKLLEEAAQRLYKEWFVDLRFPGHEHTKIVDGVPAGWEKLHISDVCDTIGGGTPSTKVKEYYQNGSIPWVTPTDITKNNSLVLLDTATKITNEGLNNSSAKMVPPGTILMTSRASVGFFGICNFPVCTNQGFISCVPYQHDAQMYLLYNLLNRVDEIRTKAGGSTYLEISKKTFRDFEIVVPDTQVLTLFQITAEKSIEQIRILSTQILKLQQARDRLLPKLMSGEVEV